MTSATLCCLVLVACTTSFNALIHNPMSLTRQTKLHAMEYPREGFFDPASKAQIPLKIAVAGGGVGGMFLGYALQKKGFEVTVYEKASAFSRFGGPIQLASNALSCVNSLSPDLFDEIMTRFTFTGTRKCGIKDGIRNTWYSVFEAITNLAEWNTLPYTGVIDRPDLQEILLDKVHTDQAIHFKSTPP
jgi:2-polyprenyl-6-methoxyphenol hydroxylase-like FAD-dependent oxidoreductase